MKKLIGIILLTIILEQANAQYFPSEYWHDGYIVTNNQDSLKGKLKYDLENDLVQLDLNGRIKTQTG